MRREREREREEKCFFFKERQKKRCGWDGHKLASRGPPRRTNSTRTENCFALPLQNRSQPEREGVIKRERQRERERESVCVCVCV